MSRWSLNLGILQLTNNTAALEVIASAASRYCLNEVSVVGGQGVVVGIGLYRTAAVGVGPTLLAFEQEDPASETIGQSNCARAWATSDPTRSATGAMRAFDGAALFWVWPDWEFVVSRAASIVLWNEAANPAMRMAVTIRE